MVVLEVIFEKSHRVEKKKRAIHESRARVLKSMDHIRVLF